MARVRTCDVVVYRAMFKRLALVIATIVFALGATAQKAMLVIHGGAGTITRASMTPERRSSTARRWSRPCASATRSSPRAASSLDAVEAAIRFLEDSPLFNAGKGAVFTHDGRNELDAVDHGRQDQEGRRGGGRDDHQESDHRRARGDGEVAST